MKHRLSSKPRIALLAAVGFLVVIGTLIQFSLHAGERDAAFTSPANHLLSIGLGLVALGAAYKLPMQLWRRVALLSYVVAIGLLVLVHQTGPVVFGAKRWLLLGGFQVQPSELMKPILAMLTAGYVMALQDTKRQLVPIGRLLLVVSLPVIFVLAQPDLGTSLVLLALWCAQLAVSGLSAKQLAAVAAIVLIAATASLPLMSPYQRGRIESFLSGHREEDASSYNVVQARIAIGSGGLTGQGLSGGTQSQLSFLPARHTDFAFAVVAEKLGLIGATAVLAAHATIALIAWRITRAATSRFTMTLAAAVATVFTMQAIVNTMMNVGLLPVTGIPLPFVSYGGTSMIISLFMIGWLLNIDRVSKES